MQKFQPYALGIFRILVGYMFLLHAMTKFIHIPYVEMFAHIEPLSLEGVARCFDLLGALSFICFIFFLYGPGKFALDNLLARRKYAKYS